MSIPTYTTYMNPVQCRPINTLDIRYRHPYHTSIRIHTLIPRHGHTHTHVHTRDYVVTIASSRKHVTHVLSLRNLFIDRYFRI